MAGTEHQLIARRLRAELDVQSPGGVEGVGHIRDDQPQQVGAAGAQATGQQIGAVSLFPADAKHPLTGLAADFRRMVQGAGHRGDGDSGKAGDVFDGDTLHEGFLLAQKKTDIFGNVCKPLSDPGAKTALCGEHGKHFQKKTREITKIFRKLRSKAEETDGL